MFARPVDPFFAYNSAFSAAERRHKEMLAQQDQLSQQELGPQQPPHLDTNQSSATASAANVSKRRKHSLHFEPEFISALDSSLQDPPPVLSRPRPCKRPRRSATSDKENHIDSNTANNSSSPFAQLTTSPPTAPETLSSTSKRDSSSSTTSTTSAPWPRFSSNTDGPSIIDLSSGEELVAMNVGQSDHKRPRESFSESSPSSSIESLREVYDVPEDGSLHPVLDHAPALPSPAKRSRVDSSTDGDGPLTPVDEMEEGRERKRPNRRNIARARGSTNTSTTKMYGYRDETMDYAGWMSDDESNSNNNDSTSKTAPRTEMALIRYEGPKTVTLADGVEALIRERWSDDHTILSLDNVQGNELVLYRPPPPKALLDNDDYDNEPSATIIKQLDEDDLDQISLASNDNSDDLIQELEDKIMDMDLD